MGSVSVDLQAFAWPCIRYGHHRVWIAPEAYHTRRERQGGADQEGWLGGIRACLERDEVNALYWGLEGGWAEGRLKGIDSQGQDLNINMTDLGIEARLGITLAARLRLNMSITPFVGIGYYQGVMRFVPPSRLTIRLCDYYKFATVGIMTKVWCDERLSVGLNIKVRQMYNGKERSSRDPDYPDETVLMKDELSWCFEMPISSQYCYEGWPINLGVTPFYEERHYGGREGYPMDFVDTKYFIYGVRFILGTIF